MLSGRAVRDPPTAASRSKVWRGAVCIYTVRDINITSFQTTTTSKTAMVYNSPRSPPSIFQGGRIKPGVYKIQNIVSKTYVDIKDDVRELCGRPSQVLEYGRDQVSSRHG